MPVRVKKMRQCKSSSFGFDSIRTHDAPERGKRARRSKANKRFQSFFHVDDRPIDLRRHANLVPAATAL
jgi:hypothetical protein